MSDKLPQGWATTKLVNLVSLALGGDWGQDPGEIPPGMAKVRVVRGTEFKSWRKEKGGTAAERCVKISSLERRRLQKDDLVLEVSGGGPHQPVGRIVLIDDDTLDRADAPLVCSNFFRLIRLHREINAGFVSHFLSYAYARGEFNEFQTETTNLRNLNVTDFLEQTEVRLAPLPEQRRIVAKLENLLGQVDVCKQRLARIQTLLKRFRQSVLAAACSGRLTADWRDENSTKLNAAGDLTSYKQTLVAAELRARVIDPTEGQEALTGELPLEWEVPMLGDVFRFIDYRGKTPKKSPSGRRLISAKNIKMGYVAEDPIEYVSEAYYASWMTRGFPRKGDIFFVTEGHTMGFTAINNRTDEFALSQRTILLQPFLPIDTRPFAYFIMSPIFQNIVRLNATGSAAVGIKASKFRGLPVPFPAFAEQQEIVRRVDNLFALADQIEARFAKAQQQVDALTPSLLARAFAGKLVPQDPNDEPASALLDRIRAAKGQAQSEVQSPKSKVARQSARPG